MTSSYSRRFLRMSKLRSSTFFWAPSMRRLTILLSMACPSSMPIQVSAFWTNSPAKMRIRSSSSARKKRVEPAGLGDDLGLARRVLRQGVEQLVLDAAALEHLAQLQRLVHVHRADEDRPVLLMLLEDFLDHRFPLLLGGAVNQVRVVDAV